MLESVSLTGSLLQTSLVALVVFLLVVWFLRNRKYSNMPPGPRGLPLIGNALQLMNVVSFRQFYKWSKAYGPAITIKFGPLRAVVLNNIEVVHEAMIKRGADFANRPSSASTEVFTDGGRDIALGQYGPTWKLHRKLSSKALRLYMQGEALDRRLHEALKKGFEKMDGMAEPYNPIMFINLIVSNIICGICFGHSYDFDDPEFCRIIELDDQGIEELGNGFFIEDFIPFVVRFPTKKFKFFQAMANELFGDIFGRKYKEHKDTFDPENIRDFTDMLILAMREAAGEEDKETLGTLDDRHLVQTISDIFFAGLDTSRMTLMFALLHMAAHQDIQAKVQEELDSILGKEELPAVKDRPQLPYTEAVLHESMRVATIAATGLPHKTVCDTKLMNYDIPKGTMVIINHWALHYDEDKWTDPEKFIPERFLDENGKLGPKPESWLPFSAGRRVCLGESVAKPELHLLFAALMHRYTWRAPEGETVITKGKESFAGIQPVPQKLLIKKRF